MSGLRSGAHECQIRSAPLLVLPRLHRFTGHAEKKQWAKIKFILALCSHSETGSLPRASFLVIFCRF
ncbi:hypothetical protein FZC69_16940 [Bacillus altitudinis]|nr:hypothetical protein FZC69_16940 [Bacillus altitudinis]